MNKKDGKMRVALETYEKAVTKAFEIRSKKIIEANVEKESAIKVAKAELQKARSIK